MQRSHVRYLKHSLAAPLGQLGTQETRSIAQSTQCHASLAMKLCRILLNYHLAAEQLKLPENQEGTVFGDSEDLVSLAQYFVLG